MELRPLGSNHLEFIWDIDGDHHEFYASSVMGGQFSLFLKAVYCLYLEKGDPHRNFGRDVKLWWNLPTEDESLRKGEDRANTEFSWDGEGSLVYFRFSRVRSECLSGVFPEKDPIFIEIRYHRHRKGPMHTYVVEGRDLCYAVAKAVTDALKKYGIHGYYRSTGDSCDVCQGDVIDPEQFLFIKAYALSVMESRSLTPVQIEDDGFDCSESSPIEKEVELLLFEM